MGIALLITTYRAHGYWRSQKALTRRQVVHATSSFCCGPFACWSAASPVGFVSAVAIVHAAALTGTPTSSRRLTVAADCAEPVYSCMQDRLDDATAGY